MMVKRKYWDGLHIGDRVSVVPSGRGKAATSNIGTVTGFVTSCRLVNVHIDGNKGYTPYERERVSRVSIDQPGGEA